MKIKDGETEIVRKVSSTRAMRITEKASDTFDNSFQEPTSSNSPIFTSGPKTPLVPNEHIGNFEEEVTTTTITTTTKKKNDAVYKSGKIDKKKNPKPHAVETEVVETLFESFFDVMKRNSHVSH